jgi:hypothetical protein
MPSQEVLSELHEVVQAAGIEGEEGCLWGAFNTTKGPTVSTYSNFCVLLLSLLAEVVFVTLYSQQQQ